MKVFGKKLATVGIALVSVGAIAVAPTVQAPPRPVPAVQLAAATSPTVLQPLVQQSNVLGALFSLDLGRFIIPPSAGQPLPTPPAIPGPSPAPTNFEFEDAIINTYHAIEPWVRWGFELATCGRLDSVGGLALRADHDLLQLRGAHRRKPRGQFRQLALGPLPFLTGLGNIARDSWDALVNLGIDQWKFWLPSLPPLPPFPFAAQQAQAQLATSETLAPADQPVAPPTVRPHPLRDALAALRRSLAGLDPVAPQNVDLQAEVDLQADVDLQAEIDPQAEVDLHVDDRPLVTYSAWLCRQVRRTTCKKKPFFRRPMSRRSIRLGRRRTGGPAHQSCPVRRPVSQARR